MDSCVIYLYNHEDIEENKKTNLTMKTLISYKQFNQYSFK